MAFAALLKRANRLKNVPLKKLLIEIAEGQDRFVEATLPEPFGEIEAKIKSCEQFPMWGNEGIFQIFVSIGEWTKKDKIYIVQTKTDKTHKIAVFREDCMGRISQEGETLMQYNKGPFTLHKTGEISLKTPRNWWCVHHQDGEMTITMYMNAGKLVK